MSEALGCSHLWKRYGDCVANRDVSLSVERGELHAVIGENGAGKSTLMRALYGLEPPTSGEVRIFGERIERPSVAESLRRKVGMVHQHFMLVPTLTVTENLVLGQEPMRGPFLDLARAARELRALSAEHRLAIDPGRLVGSLSVGEAQRVEILKVLWRGAEVLILDEPTAVLTPPEVEELFAILRGLAEAGKTVVLVTHKLDEVLRLCRRVTVMRRGEVVEMRPTAGTTAAELARVMVGREVTLGAPRDSWGAARDAQVLLEAESLVVARPDGSRALDGVSLAVRAGEIVGVAGVEGNGQKELALALTGVLPLRAGRVRLDGADVTGWTVAARRAHGLAHVPEDRLGRGLLPALSVEDNLLLGRDRAYTRGLAGELDRRRLRADAEALIARFDVRPPDPRAPVASLSGGNQQKIVVGRELLAGPRVLVCAQPTRGVDVGAIELLWAQLTQLRASGAGVLVISAELDEVLALADRVLVLYGGRLAGEVENQPDRRVATRAIVGALMLGAGDGAP